VKSTLPAFDKANSRRFQGNTFLEIASANLLQRFNTRALLFIRQLKHSFPCDNEVTCLLKEIFMKKTAIALIALAATVGVAHAGTKDAGQREQPSKADRFIEAADQNNDRAVTKDEYKTFLAKKSEVHFSKLDANGDGSISKEEFLAGAADAERADRSFDRLDVNKDGKIDLADKAEAGHKIKQRLGDQKAPPPTPGDLGAEGKTPAK
jgi:hypothetical protein